MKREITPAVITQALTDLSYEEATDVKGEWFSWFERNTGVSSKDIPQYVNHLKNLVIGAQGNDKLLQALEQNRDSFLKAAKNFLDLQLSPDPLLREGYIVPRFIKDIGWCAIFQIGYMAAVKHMHLSGRYSGIKVELVYEGDDFNCDLAQDICTHRPWYLTGKKQGNIKCGYMSVFDIKAQQRSYFVYHINELEKSRKKSEQNNKSHGEGIFWKYNPEQMYKKTIILRASKYIPYENKTLSSMLHDERILIDAVDVKNEPPQISNGAEKFGKGKPVEEPHYEPIEQPDDRQADFDKAAEKQQNES